MRNAKRIGQLVKHFLRHAGQDFCPKRRHQAAIGKVRNDVGRRAFANKTVLVEQDRARPWLLSFGFAISQIVVHPAATFQFGRPTVFRDLACVDDDGVDAHLELLGPILKRKRRTVDANGRLLCRSQLARGDKNRNRPIVAVGNQRRIALHQPGERSLDLFAKGVSIPAQNFHRPPQPPQMLLRPKELSAKSAQPFYHRDSHQESQVIKRNRDLRQRHPGAIPVSERFQGESVQGGGGLNIAIIP